MNKMFLFGETEDMHNGFIVSNKQRVPFSITEGSEDKFFIEVAGKQYLVKDSSFNKRRKRTSLAPFCEHVASTFIRKSGLLECQKTFLGCYDDGSDQSPRPVVICENIFCNKEFRPFKELHESSAGTELGNKEYTYSDVLYVLDKKHNLKGSDFDDFMSWFWKMFLFDAILGNRDRHEGNWGFIKCDGSTRMAPIFDNGSSLFPDVDLSDWKNYDFIQKRVFVLPGSQFRMWKAEYPDRAMRTNFYEMIRDYRDFFSDELFIMQSLDYKSLIFESTKDVPAGYAGWFQSIIEARFRVLILGENFDDVWQELEVRL